MRLSRTGLIIVGLLVVLLRGALAADRPNILFVMTDDQAPWALGAAGHPHAQTPNMDRLVREGAYLVNAFCVTPVCSPSRASLMTSRYGSELGITDWINPANEPDLGLDPNTICWPEILQQNGYATGLCGKWHLGEPAQFHPTKTGFAYFMGFLEGGTTPRNPVLEVDGKPHQFTGYTTNIITDHALAFLDRNQDRSFLLCVHYRAPHAPYLPVPDEDWRPFANLDPTIPNPNYPKLDVPQVKTKTREYLASIAGVDRNLGRLLERLEELHLAENTIVIFTSDHGYNIGHNGIWHKGNGHWILTEPPPATKNVPRNQRPNMYDTSLRVPAIVRWPATIKPGTVVASTVTHLDWYPTLLAAAGAPLPAGETVRGRNILPLLRGEQPAWDNDLYAEYSTHHQSHTHMRAYRTSEWKLIRDFLNPERAELYNLRDDPAETTNLIHSDAPEIQRVVVELDAKIRERMRATGDTVDREPHELNAGK